MFYVWLLIFCLLHAFTAYKIKKSHEYSSRCVSFVHSLVVTCLSLYYLDRTNNPDWVGAKNKPEHTYILGISACYIVYDVIYFIILAEKLDWEFIYHHVFVFAACFVSIYNDRSGGCLILNEIISECTTPFLNMRYFLRAHKSSFMYMLNEIIFSTLFLYCRVYLAFQLMINIMESNSVLPTIKFMTIPFYMLNLYWSYGIIKMIIRRLKNGY